MDWGIIGDAGGWLGDNWQGVAQTSLGLFDAYQGYQAGQTASDFYDAAGETAKERWNWWLEKMAPLEVARADQEAWMIEQTRPLQEQALGLQSQQMDFQKDVLWPKQESYAEEVMSARSDMLPEQIELTNKNLGLQGDYLQARSDMLPKQKELALENIALQGDYLQARSDMLPKQKELALKNLGLQSGYLDTAKRDIEQYEDFRPLEEKFYEEAMQGKDIGEAIGEAQADVVAGYKGAAGARRRSATRMGLNPKSGAFQAASRDMALNRAKDIAGARNMARRQTEDINFNRLSAGLTARQRLGQPQMQTSGYGMQVPQGSSSRLQAPQPSSYGMQAPQMPSGTPNFQASTARMSAPNVADTFVGLGNVAAQGADNTQAMELIIKGLSSLNKPESTDPYKYTMNL